jgi:hypothetical protein
VPGRTDERLVDYLLDMSRLKQMKKLVNYDTI